MAEQRRSFEKKLLDDLRNMPANKFYSIMGKKDPEKVLAHIKVFIDYGELFELNENYSSVRRISDERIDIPYHKMKILPIGISIKKIERGTVLQIEVTKKKQVKMINVEVEKGFYEVYRGNKLIAVE